MHAGYISQKQTADQQVYAVMQGMKPLACMKLLTNVASLTLTLPVDVIVRHTLMRFELLKAVLKC